MAFNSFNFLHLPLDKTHNVLYGINMKPNNTNKIAVEAGYFSPAYSRVAEHLRRNIRMGNLVHGASLPPEPELAKDFGISRVTLRHALRLLEQQGLIHKRRGKGGGNFVCMPAEGKQVSKSTVGLISNLANLRGEPYFLKLLEGVRRKLDGKAKLLLITPNGEDILEIYHENHLDGMLIMAGACEDDAKLFGALASRAIPHVLISESFDFFQEKGLVSVDADNEAGAVAATRHLLDLGHGRIAHVGGYPWRSNSCARLRGQGKALAAAGIALDPVLVHTLERGQEDKEYAHAATHELLALPQPPTAIFAAGFVLALEAMRAIRERGLRIPEDISLVGFDDFEAGEHLSPPLTTVRQPLEELGEKAGEKILEWIACGGVKEKQVVLPTELIVRGSCGSAVNP